MITCTICGKVKDFDAMHQISAVIENIIGWNMLIPFDISKYIDTVAINHNHLNEAHFEKIKMSNKVIIYFHEHSTLKDYETSQTMNELIYAMNKSKEVYFINPPKEMLTKMTNIDIFRISKITNSESININVPGIHTPISIIKVNYTLSVRKVLENYTPTSVVIANQDNQSIDDYVPEFGEVIKHIDIEEGCCYQIGDGKTPCKSLPILKF